MNTENSFNNNNNNPNTTYIFENICSLMYSPSNASQVDSEQQQSWRSRLLKKTRALSPPFTILNRTSTVPVSSQQMQLQENAISAPPRRARIVQMNDLLESTIEESGVAVISTIFETERQNNDENATMATETAVEEFEANPISSRPPTHDSMPNSGSIERCSLKNCVMSRISECVKTIEESVIQGSTFSISSSSVLNKGVF